MLLEWIASAGYWILPVFIVCGMGCWFMHHHLFDILIWMIWLCILGKKEGGKISLPSLQCADEPNQGRRHKNGIIPPQCDKVTGLILGKDARGNAPEASKAQLFSQISEHIKLTTGKWNCSISCGLLLSERPLMWWVEWSRMVQSEDSSQ